MEDYTRESYLSERNKSLKEEKIKKFLVIHPRVNKQDSKDNLVMQSIQNKKSKTSKLIFNSNKDNTDFLNSQYLNQNLSDFKQDVGEKFIKDKNRTPKCYCQYDKSSDDGPACINFCLVM